MLGYIDDGRTTYETEIEESWFLLFRERAPISTSLNAVDLYLVVCIFLVFGALMEYAAILLLLKKRRKPRYTIDSGLRKMFNEAGDSVATGHASGTKVNPQSQVQLQLDSLGNTVNPL